ncbi:PTS sugar transporter subunit IIB [Anaerorhabdus sp.]|uniref:PTS EIIB type-4 domain-containing protein n=1 Tax=bioreactor metagenome TaxID=1076179 RepID=A0A645GJY2_9ZZZZ|nr:PTS sugar transporter subunit IIB [Anaerorhabdus sp.]MEA4874476.1 PTS sugar transporter subunit IIB [Anaerorhabdus sp.]
MIKLLRVDDRLIHGAVAFSWTKQLSISLIILANDKIAKDDFQIMTLDIAKPRGTKLICANVVDSIEEIKKHLTDSVNVMIVTNNILDAANILEEVPEIKSLNLGGLRKKDDTVENLIGAIAVSRADIDICNGLVNKGYEVELRLIPDGKKTYFKDYKL